MAVSVFTWKAVCRLAASIAVDPLSDPEKMKELRYELMAIEDAHMFMYGFNKLWTANPHQRNRLGRLRNRAAELLKEIDGMDHATADLLTSGFRLRRRFDDPRVRHVDRRYILGAGATAALVRDLVALLHDAAEAGISASPRGDGRPSNSLLHETVLALAVLYQRFTGRRFTREKAAGAWTKEAAWVAEVARMITPEGEPPPSDSTLNTSMIYAVRRLKDGDYVKIEWLDQNEPKLPWLDEGSDPDGHGI